MTTFRKTSQRGILLLALWGCLLPTSMLAVPVILNHSINVEPGSIFCLQGYDFGTSPQAWLSVNGGAAAQVATLNSGQDTLTAQIPFSGSGIYSVFVRGTHGDSASVYLNQAIGFHFDTPEIAPGDTFRIFGRNLYLGAGFTPRVELVNQASGTVSTAAVGASRSFYSLTVTMPAGIPLGTNDVWVSNGAGDWNTVKTRAGRQVIVRAPGTDYWNLGVGWAADFNFFTNRYNVQTDARLALHALGNGVANDLDAINAAITKANADGGGVVYLPAGTYKVVNTNGGNLVVLKSRTVIEGDGMNDTIIKYGYGTPTAGQHFGLVFTYASSQYGAANLQLCNVNESGVWRDSIYTSSGSPSSRYFMSHVRHEKSTETGVSIFAGDRVVIQGCVINGWKGPFSIGASNLTFRGNTITHSQDTALSVGGSSPAVVEGNIIWQDGAATTNLGVRHSITCEFARDLYLADNTITSTNGPGIENNDTESILSEGGGGTRTGESVGTVVSASGNTVEVDNSTNYIANTVMCIVNGKGRGQWRSITARTNSTVTVESEWAVPPDSSSRYSTFKWGLRNVTVFHNTIANKQRGIYVYAASSTDLAIASNILVEADGIYLRPDQRLARGSFNVLYNMQIIGNVISESSGIRPAYVGLRQYQVNPSNTWGSGAINVEIRRNSVQGSGASSFTSSAFTSEGYFCDLRNEPSSYVDEGIPAVLGTVFQWNKSTNIALADYTLNTASYHTTIANNPFTSWSKVRDLTLKGASHGSVNTFFRVVPTVSVASPAGKAAEFGLVSASFMLTRTGATDAEVAVDYQIGGTATPGADYASLPSRMIIPPGAASTNITVTPLADTIAEGDETVVLTLADDDLGNYLPDTVKTGTVTVSDLPIDEWRFSHFTPTQLADSTISGNEADPDGDGMCNYAEWKAGTEPTNKLSRLTIVQATRSGTNFLVSWQSVTGKYYTIQKTANLMNGFPIDVATNIAGLGGLNSWTLQVDQATEYFRVKVEE